MSTAVAQRGAALLPLPPVNERDYYTHQEAKIHLGIVGSKSLSLFVKQGDLHRIYPPTMSHAAYLKAEVEALAVTRRLASFAEQTTPVGLLTRKHVCERFGRTARAAGGFIFHHEQAGHLHPVHLPGRKVVYYHREEVEALVASRVQVQCDEPQPVPELAEAYTAVYELMFPRLTSYVYKRYGFTREASEDLVQGTFADVWQRGAEFFRRYTTLLEQCNGVTAWVKFDLRDVVKRQKVRQQLQERVEQVWRASRIPSVEEVAVQREQLREWWQRCTCQLSPAHQAIHLWNVQGYSYAEITERLQRHGITWTERAVQNYGALARLRIQL